MILHNAKIFTHRGFVDGDLVVDGQNVFICELPHFEKSDNYIDCKGCFVVPGFVDVHTHLREPGFFYKESIFCGTSAAAKGGYTAVCSMPNLSPVPDCLQNLKVELDIIQKDAVIDVMPYASITKGEDGLELSDMEQLAPFVVGFSDDGVGLNDRALLKKAFLKAKSLDKPIVAHCEDKSLNMPMGCISPCAVSKRLNLPTISAESEYEPLKRDLQLAKETGAKYHVCHVSSKESVALIRQAKADGVSVTAETAPHYLCLTTDDIIDNDARFKMNPPLKNEDDRQALIDGINDGTIDCIATDHAPHSNEEKSLGFLKSPMGISGLETAFAAINTYLIKTNKITLQKAIECLSVNPRKIFKIFDDGTEFFGNDFCVLDTEKQWTVCGSEFLSKGKISPLEGRKLFGQNLITIKNGRIVWKTKNLF